MTSVEIKSGGCYYEESEEKTLVIVKKYGPEKKIIFSSFNYTSAILPHHLEPDIPCGVPMEHDAENCKKHHIAMNVWTVNDMGTPEPGFECRLLFGTEKPHIKIRLNKYKILIDRTCF